MESFSKIINISQLSIIYIVDQIKGYQIIKRCKTQYFSKMHVMHAL